VGRLVEKLKARVEKLQGPQERRDIEATGWDAMGC